MENIVLERLDKIEQLLQKQGLLQKDILDLKEAADYLNLSVSYIYKLTSSRNLPHYCPTGKKLFFKREELDSWLSQNKVEPTHTIDKKASDYLIKRATK